MGAWNLIPVSARIYLLILSYFLTMEEICQFSGKRVNDLARRLLKFSLDSQCKGANLTSTDASLFESRVSAGIESFPT